MAEASKRMKAMRDRRRALGLREVRLIIPDCRVETVRERIVSQVAALNARDESDALDWIEAVSEFDDPEGSGPDAAR